MQCVGMTRKLRFESNVISYGNQTRKGKSLTLLEFESNVILYGNKTKINTQELQLMFESSVISYHKYS